jgi:lysine 2,3-aminomutase
MTKEQEQLLTDLEKPPHYRVKVVHSKKSIEHIYNFPISKKSKLFRSRFFPDIAFEEWNDWHWQLAHRVTSFKDLSSMVDLSADEREAINEGAGALSLNITPYYMSLITGTTSPLRRTVIPTTAENEYSIHDMIDPLSEHEDTVAPGIVHRYPDRVLFLVTDFCSTYCRYCTRSRMVGKNECLEPRESRWEEAIRYIKDHREIRDVLLSGGDPLTLSTMKLSWLLSRLRKIEHVEIIRIGTKVPAVLPMRITHQLTAMLKQYHPLWMSLHFTHPDELTPETKESCARLVDAGIPLGNQTVLLRGINDDAETLRKLFHGLLTMRVRPYYLYQCDPVVGTSHFRTPVKRGLELIDSLRGYTTGYAVPTFVVDAPGGGGKIPLITDHIAGRDGDDLLLVNYEGKLFHYPDQE